MELIIEKSNKTLIEEAITKGIPYEEYRILMEGLVEKGTSTAKEQTNALSQYTLLNHKRMKRWDKTFRLEELSIINRKVTWLVLTESWCADAAHSMPIMNKIANLQPNVSFKVLLRDENMELMNKFGTNGTLSIPKLIMIDDATKEVIGEWGSRPKIATQMVADYKATNGKLTPEFKQELQVWYNKDKGQAIKTELLALLTLE